MRNIRKSILRGASILGLVMSAASTSSAMNNSAMNASSGNPQVMAWRMVARKNFVEGFCVAQNLNAQGIVIQSNRQVDQATVNAFKNAVAACKPGGKGVTPPAQGTVGAPAPIAPVAPVAPVPSPVGAIGSSQPVTNLPVSNLPDPIVPIVN
jgi:hypothetical protein